MSIALWAAMSCVLLSGCEMKIADKNVHRVFLDPDLAALADATCKGDADTVKVSIANGIDANGLGYKNMTPLLWAMACHNYAGVEALLKNGADPNMRLTEDGETPVFIAAGGDSVDTLRLLLEHGGNPNVRNSVRNALSNAVLRGQMDNYDLLLEMGADINDADLVSGDSVVVTLVSLAYYDRVVDLLNRGYSHDLPKLYSYVINRFVDESSAQYQNKKKVIRMLDERGIKPDNPRPEAQY